MTPLIQRTMNAISVTNEYLFDIASEIEAKEQFASDIEMEIIYVTDENVCFSFASEKKIYRYIYTPDDKSELTFKEVKEESIGSFYFADTKIIEKEPIATESIKNDFADKKPRWDLLPIEELAGVVDVYTPIKSTSFTFFMSLRILMRFHQYGTTGGRSSDAVAFFYLIHSQLTLMK